MRTLSIAGFQKNDNKMWLLVLVLISGAVRLLPEIIAYPYPIGYDVINYYLPILSNFENHWNIISNQYPFYVWILHLIVNATNSAPNIVVSSAAVCLYILFAISVYFLSRGLFQLDYRASFFVALFVILQPSLLRTSWDLHKDMLSLTAMFFAFYLCFSSRKTTNGIFAVALALCLVAVLTDRMIGLVLVGTLIVYAVIKRNRIQVILAILTSTVIISALLQNSSQIETNLRLLSERTGTTHYDQINLIILFAVTNGILIPFAIVGFVNIRTPILKISFLISLVGSLSWLIYPPALHFLPDRWITISSIFASMFAAYGIIILIRKLLVNSPRPQCILFIVLLPFAVAGILFAVTTGNAPVSIFAAFHKYVSQFGPSTMQANSISIPESKSIISAIDWMNHNTPAGSNLVVNKHWRGWAELQLEQRTFSFYEDAMKLEDHRNYYLLTSTNLGAFPIKTYTKLQLIYSNDNFLIYQVSY